VNAVFVLDEEILADHLDPSCCVSRRKPADPRIKVFQGVHSRTSQVSVPAESAEVIVASSVVFGAGNAAMAWTCFQDAVRAARRRCRSFGIASARNKWWQYGEN